MRSTPSARFGLPSVRDRLFTVGLDRHSCWRRLLKPLHNPSAFRFRGKPQCWRMRQFVPSGAIFTWQYEKDTKGTLTSALFQSALVTSFAAVVCLVQASTWETTAMQAERVFWLAGIWLVLLWVVRHRVLFAAFQIALTCAAVLGGQSPAAAVRMVCLPSTCIFAPVGVADSGHGFDPACYWLERASASGLSRQNSTS